MDYSLLDFIDKNCFSSLTEYFVELGKINTCKIF